MGGSGKGGVKVGEGQDQDVPEQIYLVHLEKEKWEIDITIIELFACNCLYKLEYCDAETIKPSNKNVACKL